MRRAIATITGTIAVLVMLLNFKTQPRAARVRPAALAPAAQAQDQAPAETPGTAPKATPKAAPDAAPKAAPDQGAASARPSAPASASASAQAPATKAAAGPTTVTGASVETGYGPVQVRITVSGNKLTDVQAVQLPNERRRSAAISNYSAPVLRSEALAAQSAQIDTVSGATYTSDGYAQSLQSALDQARVG